MKALILAAGFGTRLMPYTKVLPKPLFTLGNQTLLELNIQKLARAGCGHILINTHHLHDQVAAFVNDLKTDARIQLVHEPRILDTGGAIANIRSFLDDAPFFVVNSDIVSDLDLKGLYRAHVTSSAFATLALHHYEPFNKIRVADNGVILDFDTPKTGLAFTGIQVLSPQIFKFFPDKEKFSSIDVYRSLTGQGAVKAYLPPSFFWADIGTVPAYQETARRWTAAKAFGFCPETLEATGLADLDITLLDGDGSDRKWYRAELPASVPTRNDTDIRSTVISDHGICPDHEQFSSAPLDQLRAFVKIGTHLSTKGMATPRILAHDELSGMVALEDLGNTHLCDLVSQQDRDGLIRLYRQVIDRMVVFSREGIKGFDPSWTCQTQTYSKELILEKECRYFIDAFAKNYLHAACEFETFEDEFGRIADLALAHGHTGLMHRDMQSRNIMVQHQHIYFIDFQSARIGPIQYDLASLLIDPYVKLPEDVQQDLLAYAVKAIGITGSRQKEPFSESYAFCRLARNFQILGAFGFLSRVKGKIGFEAYIPHALNELKAFFDRPRGREFEKLAPFVKSL